MGNNEIDTVCQVAINLEYVIIGALLSFTPAIVFASLASWVMIF